MGAVCSCLGGRGDSQDLSEEQRPLNPHDVYGGEYGSMAYSHMEDGSEVRPEEDALKRMASRTADNMVDVYEIGDNSRPPPAPFAYAGQHDRLLRYQQLLAKLSDNQEVIAAISVEKGDDDDVGVVEMGTVREREGSKRPLVGTFKDAAEAMK